MRFCFRKTVLRENSSSPAAGATVLVAGLQSCNAAFSRCSPDAAPGRLANLTHKAELVGIEMHSGSGMVNVPGNSVILRFGWLNVAEPYAVAFTPIARQLSVLHKEYLGLEGASLMKVFSA